MLSCNGAVCCEKGLRGEDSMSDHRFSIDLVPMPFAIDCKTACGVNVEKENKCNHRDYNHTRYNHTRYRSF